MHPGLGDPRPGLRDDGTEHRPHDAIDWSDDESWEAYNESFAPRVRTWDSGQAIERIMAPLDGNSLGTV